MELLKASHQWASRPDDESFWGLEDMHFACLDLAKNARTAKVATDGIRMLAEDGEVIANGRTGTKARLTNYAFGQLSRLAGAPAGYLAKLNPETAALCLNEGLAKREASDVALLFHDSEESGLLLRAAVSPEYERVWNGEITGALRGLSGGWVVPPARARAGVRTKVATEADVLKNASHKSLGVKVGDLISPAGAYASDRDMFVFMVDDSKRIDVDGASLCRGFFCWNSEVGDKSFGIQTFLFDSVCGNHIVWGAKEVKEIRIRHTKSIKYRWEREAEITLTKYANSSISDDVARIESCQRKRIGDDKDDVLTKLFERKSLGLGQAVLAQAWDVAESTPRYGDPRSAWAMAQGITEVSQRSKHADERVKLDRSAGKILEMAF